MASRLALTLLVSITLTAATYGQGEADVILVVDNSGSMDVEVDMVETQLNSFASTISAAGIDLHLILISDDSMCVPAPLGSGSCGPDQNLPRFRHVAQTVDSSNALQLILATYPSWSSSIRSSASTTVVVVTDDESNMSAATFQNQFLALDPAFQDYRFHALVATSACPPTGAEIGQEYMDLAMMTGGQSFNLCDQDFGPDFDSMALDVVAGASLSYCTAGTTTNGCVPWIASTGVASASAASGFTLTVNEVEGQKTGMVFYGVNNTGWTPVPWGGGSTSYLCVQPPTQRTIAQNSGGTVGQCNGAISIDWNAYIASHPGALGAPFAGGESVYAQGWFRDPSATKTTNLSNALAFVVQP